MTSEMTAISREHRDSRAKDVVLDRLAATSRAQGLDGLASHLAELGAWLGDDLVEIVQTLAAIEAAPKDVAGSAARHLLDRPGKRIRALSVLLAAKLGGKKTPPSIRDLAIAAELVHAATLLHDDVIDEGTERRGAPAARMIYGNSASILGGDHLLIEALRRVEGAAVAGLLPSMLDVIGEMIAAEAIQLGLRGASPPDDAAGRAERRTTYLRVVRGKTAALFRWSFRAGAAASGQPEEIVAALGEAGEALGIAFQLVDDALDIEGDADAAGKDVLADLREGKLTWPLLAALERDQELAAMLADPERLELAAIAQRVRLAGGAEAARREAEKYGEMALSRLGVLGDSPSRRGFEALVRAALERTR